MDNMQENTTGIVPEEQENTIAAAAEAENKPRPWYKLPMITIPALLALAAMLYVFGNAAYYSMVRYSAKNGLLGSPFVGLVNYRRLFDGQGWSAVKDTLVIKILALAVCGAISALMCSLYRVMKKPGTLLAVACLWLVPVARCGLPGWYRPPDNRDLLLHRRPFRLPEKESFLRPADRGAGVAAGEPVNQCCFLIWCGYCQRTFSAGFSYYRLFHDEHEG